ncbi:hypothetical protein SRHO_G00116180 [Serrasalmus rhombeus]
MSDLSVVLVLPCSPTQKVATKRCNPTANVSRQEEQEQQEEEEEEDEDEDEDEAVLERVAAGQQSRAEQRGSELHPNSPVSVREGNSGFYRPRNEEQKRHLSRRTPLSSRRTQHGSH